MLQKHLGCICGDSLQVPEAFEQTFNVTRSLDAFSPKTVFSAAVASVVQGNKWNFRPVSLQLNNCLHDSASRLTKFWKKTDEFFCGRAVRRCLFTMLFQGVDSMPLAKSPLPTGLCVKRCVLSANGFCEFAFSQSN